MSRARSALRPRYLKLHALLVYAFLFAPIIVLVVFSFNEARSSSKFTNFSTKWYDDLIHNADALRAFRTTLKVAIVATLVATVLGTLAAFALHAVPVPGSFGLLDAGVHLACDPGSRPRHRVARLLCERRTH